jgi:hypothetical protein
MSTRYYGIRDPIERLAMRFVDDGFVEIEIVIRGLPNRQILVVPAAEDVAMLRMFIDHAKPVLQRIGVGDGKTTVRVLSHWKVPPDTQVISENYELTTVGAVQKAAAI